MSKVPTLRSRRRSTRIAILLGVLVGGMVAISYSWTFTRIGRLDYRAAIIARLASLSVQDTSDGAAMDFSPQARKAANRLTQRMIAAPKNSPSVSFVDDVVRSGATEIPIRIYTPTDALDGAGPDGLPIYLDIHGGGWWMGDGFPFHELTQALAAKAGMIIVSVDYRLAPEHPYPAGLEDCEAVLRWLAMPGAVAKGDPTRIAIGGASAGGNLSAALALKMRDEGGPKIAFQFLSVPATDLSGTREWHSYDEAGEGYVLTVSGIESMIEAYVPDVAQRMDPYVSPLLARNLEGLPPALVATALFDPLRDQGESYARRLEDAGVPTILHREPGALHGFLGSPERQERVADLAARLLRAAFGTTIAPSE